MRAVLSTPKARPLIPGFLEGRQCTRVRTLHESLPGYAQTPLVSLPALAKSLGIGRILVKDESARFGLRAFKGLGAGYALACVAAERLGIDTERPFTLSDITAPGHREALGNLVFTTATDGNHGKSVAWAAGLLGCRSHIFMPEGTAEARVQAIAEASQGHAEVTVTDMNYDGTVALAAQNAEEQGWILIQDTSWPGYERIPGLVMQGYTTMVREALSAMGAEQLFPTHVFLQAGVGSMAAAVTAAFLHAADELARPHPVFGYVEAWQSACLMASYEADSRRLTSVPGIEPTIMAGLNCGTPCHLAWPLIRDAASAFFSVEDAVTERGMRRACHPLPGDPAIEAGECGAVTLGVLEELLGDKTFASVREAMGLTGDSVVFLVNTEGATNPRLYAEITQTIE